MVTIVALKFAMSSHFSLPKNFALFVPTLSNGASRATSHRKPKTNDQILPSPIVLPIEKKNQVTVEPVLATTWQKRPPENCGHTISVPRIHGFKCTECVLENATTWEMRIADTKGRPKASIQPAKCDHIRNIERKTLFRSSNFSFAGTPNERSSCLQAPFGKAVANYAPAYTWEPRIANVMARAGACVQLDIDIFWTKPGKWDHLKNRTTISQSLRWS